MRERERVVETERKKRVHSVNSRRNQYTHEICSGITKPNFMAHWWHCSAFLSTNIPRIPWTRRWPWCIFPSFIQVHDCYSKKVAIQICSMITKPHFNLYVCLQYLSLQVIALKHTKMHQSKFAIGFLKKVYCIGYCSHHAAVLPSTGP